MAESFENYFFTWLDKDKIQKSPIQALNRFKKQKDSRTKKKTFLIEKIYLSSLSQQLNKNKPNTKFGLALSQI